MYFFAFWLEVDWVCTAYTRALRGRIPRGLVVDALPKCTCASPLLLLLLPLPFAVSVPALVSLILESFGRPFRTHGTSLGQLNAVAFSGSMDWDVPSNKEICV
jgi:hypothetical protein